MMEYKIICKRDFLRLEEAVNDLLNDGWLPLGGLTQSVKGFPTQAITRTCKPKLAKQSKGLSPRVVINLWNQIVAETPLAQKRKVISSLENSIRLRINEKGGFPTTADWGSYFNAIVRSRFLLGNNDRNWKATLEWAVKPKSIAGVIEGKYHGKV